MFMHFRSRRARSESTVYARFSSGALPKPLLVTSADVLRFWPLVDKEVKRRVLRVSAGRCILATIFSPSDYVF
jgi:hypothetical protein